MKRDLTAQQQRVFDFIEDSEYMSDFKDTIKRVPTEEESGPYLQSALEGEEVEVPLSFEEFDTFEVKIEVEYLLDHEVDYEVLTESYLLEVEWLDNSKILLR